jgi:hypothetical protein
MGNYIAKILMAEYKGTCFVMIEIRIIVHIFSYPYASKVKIVVPVPN